MPSKATESQSVRANATARSDTKHDEPKHAVDSDPPKYSTPLGARKDYADEMGPFFAIIGKDGVIGALKKLDAQLRNTGNTHIISGKRPINWFGKEINPGRIGFFCHGGQPKVLVRPGLYPGFPFGNWWAKKWCGTRGLSETVIEFHGLTILQVSKNQAAVFSDPQKRVFVTKNAGWVAIGLEGPYDVLAVVDQTNLSTPITNRFGNTLGHKQEVTMPSNGSNSVVALFLDIPANNCAVLQYGDHLELRGSGQHYITTPHVTLRGMYTYNEDQIRQPITDLFTRDEVPLTLTIYFKWKLASPLKLATHGYHSPSDALTDDKIQSIVTRIVASLDYGAMLKRKSQSDALDPNDDASATFIDVIRTRALDELQELALEYGIIVKDIAVVNYRFTGPAAIQMEELTAARIKAHTRNTEADADAYGRVAAARATTEGVQLQAQAVAEATRLSARAEADAINLRGTADAAIKDKFAQEIALRRIDSQRAATHNTSLAIETEPGVQGD